MKSKKSYSYIIIAFIAFIASFSLNPIAYAGGTVAALDFNSTAISSYSNQDGSGSVSIEDNGNKLRLVGNTWKKIALPYNVTPNTVLEFVYYSGNQGEIQGIGMSKTNNQNESQTFQLYGTQNFGVSDYADYANSVPNSKRYVIPIGQYFTGTQAYLFFANDDDANNGAESIFKDVKIYESGTVAALDFSSTTISSYGDQDVSGSVSIEDNGNKLRLVGNTWKKIALPYNITPNTVLEFVYYSGNQGEIQGIGMSSINSLNLSQTFQLYGSQSVGISDYEDYANSAPNSKRYVIPIGQYYTGTHNYLFFVNDDDANNSAESIFKDVKIYENTGASTPVAISSVAISSVSISSVSNSYTLDVLDTGKLVYSDRSYNFTNVPANLVGNDYIVTANDDKYSTSSSFLSFDVNQSVKIYVAYDESISSLPSWLGDWVDTGDSLIASHTTLALYSKEFPAGTITLGGNEGNSSSSMYSVIIGSTGNASSGSGGTTSSSTSSTSSTTSSTSSADTAAEKIITLSWEHSSPELMDGYKVYTGSTPENANNEVEYIPVNELNDLMAPSVDYLSKQDLGLNTGDTICFRTKAYKDGELSGYSSAVCTVL